MPLPTWHQQLRDKYPQLLNRESEFSRLQSKRCRLLMELRVPEDQALTLACEHAQWQLDHPGEAEPLAPPEIIGGTQYRANPVLVAAHKITRIFSFWDGSAMFYLDNGGAKSAGRDMLARYTPVVGDYWVIQTDGCEYVNPKDVFERKYAPVPETAQAPSVGNGERIRIDFTRAQEVTPEVEAAVMDAFEYHPWSADQVEAGKRVRTALALAVLQIIRDVPAGPDRTVAIRKIREARMDANSAITHGGKY